MRRQRSILLALALFSLSACARSRRTPDHTVVYIMDAEITELDPRWALNANDTKISRLVAAGLVAVDQPTREPRPDLAEEIVRIDDTTWEVTLRADARFSDGTAVTAEDVVYTFQSILDPGMKSFMRKSWEERLAGVEGVDARRVRFRLKQPLATFLTDIDMGIVQARGARAEGGRWPGGLVVGAGPFRVVALSPGQEVVLERNPHYHGGAPPMQRVQVKTVRDGNSRLLVLVGGSADLTQNTVRPDLVDEVRKHRLNVLTAPSAILTYLMFHNEDPVLADPRVRRAIAHAIDREKIIRAKMGGHAVPATGLLPPGHWAYEAAVDHYPYDPERARALLDEAGYPDPDGPGGRPRLTLSYKCSTDPFRVSIARIIAQELDAVGIAVELRSFEFATFFSDVKQGNYQLAQMQTSEIVEPDMHFLYFHSSRIPSQEQPDLHNRWRYRSAELDRLVEAGRRELDRNRRRAIYADAQRLIARDLPIFPLWHEDNIALVNVDLEGYQVLPNARLSALSKVWKRGTR
jgi:peptide/nickel transport system substrate-binding protein